MQLLPESSERKIQFPLRQQITNEHLEKEKYQMLHQSTLESWQYL